MSQAYSNPNVEIWEEDGTQQGYYDEETLEPGFYWWHCFPGCLPDSDPQGPYPSYAEALAGAQETFDDGMVEPETPDRYSHPTILDIQNAASILAIKAAHDEAEEMGRIDYHKAVLCSGMTEQDYTSQQQSELCRDYKLMIIRLPIHCQWLLIEWSKQ